MMQAELASKEGNLLIQGDMNIDLLNWRDDSYYLKRMAEEYQSFIGRNGLELIDYGITWERYHQNGEIKKSSLDHSLTNIPSQVEKHKREYVSFSDHFAIYVDLAMDMKKVKKQKVANFTL